MIFTEITVEELSLAHHKMKTCYIRHRQQGANRMWSAIRQCSHMWRYSMEWKCPAYMWHCIDFTCNIFLFTYEKKPMWRNTFLLHALFTPLEIQIYMWKNANHIQTHTIHMWKCKFHRWNFHLMGKKQIVECGIHMWRQKNFTWFHVPRLCVEKKLSGHLLKNMEIVNITSEIVKKTNFCQFILVLSCYKLLTHLNTCECM